MVLINFNIRTLIILTLFVSSLPADDWSTLSPYIQTAETTINADINSRMESITSRFINIQASQEQFFKGELEKKKKMLEAILKMETLNVTRFKLINSQLESIGAIKIEQIKAAGNAISAEAKNKELLQIAE